MLTLPGAVKIYLATTPVDMRKRGTVQDFCGSEDSEALLFHQGLYHLLDLLDQFGLAPCSLPLVDPSEQTRVEGTS